jgi:hypothetical protein
MAGEGSKCLMLGVVAEVIGLLQTLQADVHHPQDVASCAWVPGDLEDRGIP